MELTKAIRKLKEYAVIIQSDGISPEEKKYYLSEVFEIIESLDIPELIGDFNNEYIS